MSVSAYFRFPRVRRRLYAGPLGPYVDAFAEQLAHQGYAKRTICFKLRVVGAFSRWLERAGLGAVDVDPSCHQRFLAHRQRVGGWSADDAAALKDLASLLRERGVTTAPEAAGALTEVETMALAFRAYLLAQRGLAVVTANNYARIALRFLGACFGAGPVRAETLTAADVIGFVQRHAHAHSHCWTQAMITALRSLLRYCHHHGITPSDLAPSVPAVASWSQACLPRFLSSDQIQQVLQLCDRSRATGRRDYAILLLCVRLGLRAGEIARLRLEDIDWHSGAFTIRGKGGREDRMPLPADVGAAIVDYLAQGRPSCQDRHVFIRAVAPHLGLRHSSSVSNIASRALARADIPLPRAGAHLFRHSLATEMLIQGASLAEIGQVLRHQHPDTTRLYAKVDLPSLRQLASAWPGGEQ